MNDQDLDRSLVDHFATMADTSARDGQVAGILSAVGATRQQVRAGAWRILTPPPRWRRSGQPAFAPISALLALGLAALLAVVTVAGLSRQLAEPAYEGVFEALGPVWADERMGGSAVLPDGRVLVTSERDVRLFDPTTDTFEEGTPLQQVRWGETLVLPDGRVSFLGYVGETDAPGLETYDPLTGASRMGPVLPESTQLGATGLQDGRLLLFAIRPDRTATAMTYDPTSDRLAAAGPLVQPRRYPVAWPLADGRVLVLGSDGEADGSAEVFDPATDTFALVGQMTRARSNPNLVDLADGRVLVIGGAGEADKSAEVFDPSSGTFAAVEDMATARTDFTATLLRDGRVLVAGGVVATGTEDEPKLTPSDLAETFDPSTGTFSVAGSLRHPRVTHAAVPLTDGRVLVLGGAGREEDAGPGQLYYFLGGAMLDSAETFDPATDTFTPTRNLTTARAGPVVHPLADGRVLVMGSICANQNCSGRPAQYDAEVFR